MDLIERLINLSKVFLDGRGLPFLGAGVSRDSRTASLFGQVPTVNAMIQLLVERAKPEPDQGNRQRKNPFLRGIQETAPYNITYIHTLLINASGDTLHDKIPLL